MRFFHISDLHIGKQLNGIDLTEDLRHVLFAQVLGSAYEKFRPDALIIAGDIYDRSSPSAEAVAFFDELLSRAAELRLPVYAISGNHDNAQRVSYGRQLFEVSGIHLSEPFSEQTPLTLLECGGLDIALLPYFSAEAASQAFGEELEDMTAALKAVFARAELPREGRPCLLVAHLSVSEKAGASVGSLEAVEHSVLEPFTYTALGHFHDPHCAGSRKVRYCGSPVCFSAREAASPQKYLDVVDIDDSGNVTVENHPLQPLRGVKLIKDSFEQLMSDKYARTEDYVFVTVTGDNAETDAARRILAKFPNCASIRYEDRPAAEADVRDTAKKSFDEMFGDFFKLATGGDIQPELLETAKALFEQAQGGDCT